VARAIDCAGPRKREPLKRTVSDPERGAQRRKNNEIKFGSQLYMVFVPALARRASPGATSARAAGRFHAALGRTPEAPPGGRADVAST
jgi:hypothetical protein